MARQSKQSKVKESISSVRIRIEVRQVRSLTGGFEYSLDGQRFSGDEIAELERQNPNIVFVGAETRIGAKGGW